jgi:hypothetical protein
VKSFLVATVMLVSGLAWAAPVDLSTQQIRCNSAAAGIAAAVVTMPGGEAFIYAEDMNNNQAFDDDEIFIFEGSLNVTTDSPDFNQYISGYSGVAFSTVQEVVVEAAQDVIKFHYGFTVGAYPGTEFALLSARAKDGSDLVLIPFSCAVLPPN